MKELWVLERQFEKNKANNALIVDVSTDISNIKKALMTGIKSDLAEIKNASDVTPCIIKNTVILQLNEYCIKYKIRKAG